MSEKDRGDRPGRITRRDFLGGAALALAGCPAFSWLDRVGSVAAGRHPVRARVQAGNISLENELISAEWVLSPAGLKFSRVEERRSGRAISGPLPAFSLSLRDGEEIRSTRMRLVGRARAEELPANAGASRASEHFRGRTLRVLFTDEHERMRVEWRAVLREGSHYIRQQITVEARGEAVPVSGITLGELELSGAATAGTVKGSPVIAGNWFCGFEHPLAQNTVRNGRVQCALARQLPLERGQKASYSSVIGAADDGQMRRSFLRYIERERAHPYRSFLHYNSWYDLGYFTPYNQTGALDVIGAFGRELHEKRGVRLDSFLFDDGWDDHHSLWKFNSGFPHGFAPIQKAAENFGAAPGVWLSPWGGYDGPRKERLAYGKEHDYEENAEGFVLSGPRYFERFRSVCIDMLREYGVNQFKFDGTGEASRVYPGSRFNSDFDAMIHLIGTLRAAKPELYVNLTTGTYPSPFWLNDADSTWRGGEDHSFAGTGTNRQRWITYRDGATYEHVVKRGPLYPLNSLMLHGLIYARYARGLESDAGNDFPDEVHSYFGTGTQLQEMYISHDLLSAADWDVLAEAARWSRENADILVDTHWIGGDPAGGEVYGWASWSPRGGVVTLRNPDGRPQQFEMDAQAAFELPANAPRRYRAKSPWKTSAPAPAVPLEAGHPRRVTLGPFEVLTWDATPA